MKVKAFNELFATSGIKSKCKIWLNKEFVFSGYLSDVSEKEKKYF